MLQHHQYNIGAQKMTRTHHNQIKVYHTFLRVDVCIGTNATVLPINAADKRTRTAVDFILLLLILSMGM